MEQVLVPTPLSSLHLDIFSSQISEEHAGMAHPTEWWQSREKHSSCSMNGLQNGKGWGSEHTSETFITLTEPCESMEAFLKVTFKLT